MHLITLLVYSILVVFHAATLFITEPVADI